MSEGSRRLALSSEFNIHDLPGQLFAAEILERSLTEVRADGWSTSVRSLEPLGEPAWRVQFGHRHEDALFRRDDTLLHIQLAGSHFSATVAAPDVAAVDAELERLRALFPAPDLSSRHEVQVTFWTYGAHGPMPSWRSIAVPGWDEIQANYGAATRGELQRLMRGFQPAHGGQLILWHGLAGTGKTFALRALAWEWRDWCELHYIVDPDSFFGEHADYLISVLLQPGYAAMPMHSDMARMMAMSGGATMHVLTSRGGDDDEDEDVAEGESKAWRVLLLEDTGELLSADARDRMGQGLSRFLNVVDGLIGQGLRVLVLVTTNEKIGTLHPAVARPGRAAANIEFAPLETGEANSWLERAGVDERAAEPETLASLFARLARAHGEQPPDEATFGS